MVNIIDAIEEKLGMVDSIPRSGVGSVPSRVAQEIAFWKGKKETEESVQPRLGQYWENISFPDWDPSGTPWSASFISWILRDTGFPGNAAHFKYVENIADGKSPGWTAYSIPKNIGKLKLSPGDVLVRARGSGNPQSSEYWQTHGDVIWQITNGEALLVGGNLGNTAKIATRIKVDSKGAPMNGISGYKIILKKKKSSVIWIVGILAVASIGIGWWMSKKP